MKAMAPTTRGDVSSLSQIELPDPVAGDGEVRVRVHASALNPADLKVVRGDFVARFIHAKTWPLVVGYDFSGVVDQVGGEVKDLAVGDEVFGFLAYAGETRQGALAERVTIDAGSVGKKPDDLAHETVAAAATVGLTALQALRDRAGLTGGQRVLVIGASGGVGTYAVSVAKSLGAHVTGVCSGYAADFVRERGADEIVDRQTTDPLALDERFDVVFDTTGTYGYGTSAHLLTKTGVFVTTVPSPGFVLGKLRTLLSSRTVSLVVVDGKREDLETLAEMIAGGTSVPIAERFAVRDTSAALERMAEGRLLGKIAIDVATGF